METKEEFYPAFIWHEITDPDINFVLETIGASQYVGTYKDRQILYALNGYSQVTPYTWKELDINLISLAKEGLLKRI